MPPSPPAVLPSSPAILPSPSTILRSPSLAQVLHTHEVLQNFSRVIEDEEDPEVIDKELGQESQTPESSRQLAENLRRVKDWYDEKLAKAHASPIGFIGRTIEGQLPRALRLHKEPTLPPDNELIELAHHFYPLRGQLKVEVFDFGEGRAEHFQTHLSEIAKCCRGQTSLPLHC
jgi:hypothetical protein